MQERQFYCRDLLLYVLFSTLFTFINALCAYFSHNTPYVSDIRK